MAVTGATLADSAQLRNDVGTEADDTTRSLTAEWVASWAALVPAMVATVGAVAAAAALAGRWPSRWELVRTPGVQAVLEAASVALQGLGVRTRTSVTDASWRAVDATVATEPRLIASQLPAAERYVAATRFAERVLPRTVDVMKARIGQQIESVTRPLSAQAADAMRRELVRGVTLETNPDVVARAMVDRVQGAFEGGLSRAIVLSRTEILDAYRVAAQCAHTANADVLAGWQWLSARDSRVCPSCLAMNGATFPATVPGPWDHQQGRCARLPVLRSWRDFGIGLDEPADMFPDARAWFFSQPEAIQLRIMGPARLELLRSGAVSWDALATRRDSAGWRPSYTPTPVNDLRRIAARRIAA